jgi:hypothetical protein
MRPEHIPSGDPCQCGKSARSHRIRVRDRERNAYQREYSKTRKRIRESSPRTIIGIDGEGFESGSIYGYMAAWSTQDEISHVEDIHGLSTTKCVDFLLDLPRNPLKFGFSLGYDYTHILKDLDNRSLYSLNHPELRLPEAGPPKPVYWQGGGSQYSFNMLSGRLTVSRYDTHLKNCADPVNCIGCKKTLETTIWDCFKFFQSSFIVACKAWDVITAEEFEILKEMKAKRPEFAKPKTENDFEWVKVKRYCGLECAKMAELATRLIRAHDEAGLTLKQYFGAGSTGAAMLDKMHARQFIRPSHRTSSGKIVYGTIEYGRKLRYALACAFFGGRFEILRPGPIRQTVWSYDISSAYPYAFTFLPCLVHGDWELFQNPTLDQIEKADAAVVRYVLPWVRGMTDRKESFLGVTGTNDQPWGPFPFRNEEGNILFPATSGGGWLHKVEILAGMKLFPNVVLKEAWIYNTKCSCDVLRKTMPENYKLRCAWGKEGKGQVAKLGQNSCYGKTAQTKGRRPPYQNFVWAGMTTASCRAQVLEAMGKASHLDKIIMIATDGIFSTERLKLDPPKDTGTFETVDVKSGKLKPLGGWEEKEMPAGIFLIRPGIAFPLEGEFKETEAKARGIGKTVLTRLRDEVLERWQRDGMKKFGVTRPMFHGMKSQIYVPSSGSSQSVTVADETGYRRGSLYGRFTEQETTIDYFCYPKRPCMNEKTGNFCTWSFSEENTSYPYRPILGEPAAVSKLIQDLKDEKAQLLDQPDMEDLMEIA